MGGCLGSECMWSCLAIKGLAGLRSINGGAEVEHQLRKLRNGGRQAASASASASEAGPLLERAQLLQSRPYLG